jgi:hypothetical protein
MCIYLIGSSHTGCCRHGNEQAAPIEGRVFVSCLAERVQPCQEGLCSLVSFISQISLLSSCE